MPAGLSEETSFEAEIKDGGHLEKSSGGGEQEHTARKGNSALEGRVKDKVSEGLAAWL